MPIGIFARRTGLTPSALRFYDDAGLLHPAEVDPVSGYRRYRRDQSDRADMLRRLREIAMPLAAVREVLDSDAATAARIIDAHVAGILDSAGAARRTAVHLTAALTEGLPVATVKGPVLADAIEQVLTATVQEPTMPVLSGIHIEAGPDAVTLTATDRYRLATRTLVPDESASSIWSATVDGADLRAAVSEIRRSTTVHVEASPHDIRLRLTGRDDQHCRLVAEPFPDHRAMLTALPTPSTRVTVAKNALLQALEEATDDSVTLTARADAFHVDEHPITADVSGPGMRISFHLTTFHPAVSTAIGPDVMLDLRGPDLPVTVRSADRGDLTTLAMPVKPEGAPR